MGPTPEHVERRGNRVLAALDEASYARLGPRLETVTLAFKQVLFATGAIDGVYFPLNSLVSLVTSMANGSSVEVAAIGREGMIGLPAFLGASALGRGQRAVVQVGGQALYLEAGAFLELADSEPTLRRAVERYIASLLNQLGQQAACNRLHSLEERCSRWLLMANDQVGLNALPVTQGILAQMLGVRRSSVTLAAGTLQRARLIRYQRRLVTILDRDGLEATACECYGITRTELTRPLL